jgi:hypothetical protein
MSYTWGDIRLSTLQKCFASTGNSVTSDSSTKDYIDAMPNTANEVLQMIATAGKYKSKSYSIAHYPIDNILSNDPGKIIRVLDGTYSVTADGAKSYYFRINGTGTAKITVGTTDTEIAFSNSIGYTEYKGLISNASSLPVTVTFTSDYPFSIRNFALYKYTFPSADNVPEFADYVRYKMTDLVDDFFQLDPTQIYFEGEGEPTYLKAIDYWQEGTKTLVLPRDKKGNYTIYYKAYLAKITPDTTDETVLDIDPEVAVVMPIYMASQLYKDDDNGIATSYRNEFEVAYERLSNKANLSSHEQFTSESGWI